MIQILSIIVLFIGMKIPIKLLGRGIINFNPTGYNTIHYNKFENTYEGILWGYGKVGADEYLCRKPTFFYEEMLRKKQGKKPRI